MMELHLHTGEVAHAKSFDGQVFVFESPRAFAPGAPIRFAARFPDQERTFEGRCLGSKRAGADVFTVRSRFVNLTRVQRDALAEGLGA
ncbi:MAG: hypothetical protein AAF436_13665 [Myxococcota bacterium]